MTGTNLTMDLDIIRQYLVECRIISAESVDVGCVYAAQGLGDVVSVDVCLVDGLLTHLSVPVVGRCTVYVFHTSGHVKNTLKLCRTNIMDCVLRNVLLIDYLGIRRLVHVGIRYGVLCLPSSDHIDSVLDACRDVETQYTAAYSQQSSQLDIHILRIFYQTRSSDLLQTFSADYAFIVYHMYKQRGKDITDWLYIVRESDCAHIIRLVREDANTTD